MVWSAPAGTVLSTDSKMMHLVISFSLEGMTDHRAWMRVVNQAKSV